MWVNEEILFAGFVVRILKIVIEIIITVPCEETHKMWVVFQIVF